MAGEPFNRLPAGLMSQPGAPDAGPGAAGDYSEPAPSSGGSSLALVLALIALLLASASLYLTLANSSSGTALSPDQRAAIRSIAADLRSMQQKEFTTSSPELKAVVQVQKAFPLSDILPANFSVPLAVNVPIQTTLTGLSQNGQVVSFRINETLQIRAQIPVDVSSAGRDLLVNIDQEVPVNTRIRGSFKFSNVFPAEFNSIITRLEDLGAEPGGQ